MDEQMKNIPMIPLRGVNVLPGATLHFIVNRKRSLEALEKAMEKERKIFLLMQKDEQIDDPDIEELYRIGVVAEVRQIVKMQKQTFQVLVYGEKRAHLDRIVQKEPWVEADITLLEDILLETGSEAEEEGMKKYLKELLEQYLSYHQRKSISFSAENIERAESVWDLLNEISAGISFDEKATQEILEALDLNERYQLICGKLVELNAMMQIKSELEAKVRARVEKGQREYVLREEMRQIQEELGENDFVSEAEELETSIRNLKAPKEVKKKLEKELKRFKHIGGNQAEAGVIRTYIETMLEMPWEVTAKEERDASYARKVMETEHYGMEEVKERMIEFLAVRSLTTKGQAPILCLSGPPGTGKTSIVKSLAKALGRPYVRISLGGIRDEAEIRGHRKTYVGAMPGRIADAMRRSGVKNPVILLDEIDKVSNDYKGDTFSALLEVLDSEQNDQFRDHYLEVPLDLSEVMFVTTANTLQTIPRPLLDRMEVMEVSSYTSNEKMHIALEHLIPKQMERHGLQPGTLKVSKKVVWKMIEYYTREAGVRQLERKAASICRKAAKEIWEGHKKKVQITESNLEKYLGKERYRIQPANEEPEVGIVRGLAWTSVGGDTLQIEVNVLPGKGELLLTGQLGDVMKESARTGISYIRSVGEQYKIENSFFSEHDIHIHIPEGAVPKDGPSAGITMATAVLSAVTGKKVRCDVAMTGEITLRGRVLPIGGLKEKLIAAQNAGIRTVLVPKENERDVKELSDEITKGLEIVFVSQMKEVLEKAFVCE